jgi:hypothetical protein
MGRKFPIDTKFEPLVAQNDSIYAPVNSSGYKINVNHPKIKPLYEAYHKHIGHPLHIHLSHAQRMEFEMMVLRLIEKKRSREHVQQSDSDGSSDP